MNTNEICVIGLDFNEIESSRDERGVELNKGIKVGFFSIETFQSELKEITEAICSSIDDQVSNINQYHLDEITVKLEVSTTGKLAILGNGISISGTGGIELKFKKND